MKKIQTSKKLTGNKKDQEVFKRLAEIKSMPSHQLVGEILMRAQLIEEFMRAYIVNGSKKYNHPRQVKGTFGQLKMIFKKIYPEEASLSECLDAANEVRNDIAHNTFLIDWFIGDLLKGHKNSDIDRFNHRGFEKMLHIIDDCLVEFRKFMKRVTLRTYDLKISASQDTEKNL